MSKMLQAISGLRKTVVEFHNYLCLTKEHTKSWQRDPIQTMIKNVISMARKLDKLSYFVERHQNNPNSAVQYELAEKVYSKLIEYIARVQEAISGCMLREKNNNNLPYCEFLCDLAMRIDQILLKPDNFHFSLPKKHWLTIEQTAFNLADDVQEYDKLNSHKTVLFRQLRWPNYDVTNTTKEIEFAKQQQIEKEEKEWLNKTLAEIKEQKESQNRVSAKL